MPSRTGVFRRGWVKPSPRRHSRWGAPAPLLLWFTGHSNGASLDTTTTVADGNQFQAVSAPAGGFVAYDTTTPFRGTSDARFSAQGTAGFAYGEWGTSTAGLSGVGSNSPHYTRLRVRFPIMPPDTTGVPFLQVLDSAGNVQGQLIGDSNGKIKLADGAGTVLGTSTATFTSSTWTDVGIGVLTYGGAGVGQLEAKIYTNGSVTETLSGSADTLRSGGSTRVRMGMLRSLSFTTVDVQDVAWSTVTYPTLPTVLTIANTFDGGSNGSTVTTANAGGTGNTQLDSVTIGSGATVTFDNTHTHGGLALKCNAGSTPADAGVEWSTSAAPLTSVYLRAYYYATSNPTSHHRIFDVVTAGGAALVSGVMHHTDGTLIVLDGGFGIAAQTTTAIALNQWVRIELYVVCSATTGFAQARLFNSADSGTATEDVSSSANINTSGAGAIYRFGFNGDTYDTGRTVWLDDIGLSAQTWLGPTGSPGASPAAEQPAAAGSAADATVAVGAASESADGWGTRFDGDFTGISSGPTWTDNVVHGGWYQTPSGNQVVKIVEQGGTKYLRVASEPIGGGVGTLAGLALSRDTFSNWSTLAVEYVTDTQWRTPTPNVWELGWVFFNFTDSNHFYYVLLYPDGNFELGKEWTNGVTQFQDFLATGTTSATYSLGDLIRVEVDQVIVGSSVTFNVRSKNVTRGDVSFQTIVSGFTDDGSRSSGAAYLSGHLGLYVEDSAARFRLVDLATPKAIDSGVVSTATPGTPAAAGTAPDASAAVTAPAGLASAAGAGFDATVSVGAAPAAPAGTGAGFDTGVDVTVPAGTTVAAGSAADALAGVGGLAGAATSNGVAFDVDHVDATAGPDTPAGSGTAPDPAAALTVPAGAGTGAGTAFDATSASAGLPDTPSGAGGGGDAATAVTVNADVAAGTGVGYDTTQAASVSAEATATAGVAPDAVTALAVNAETTSSSGSAYDATVATNSSVTAPAESADGVGAGYDAAAAVTATAQVAAGVGAAQDPAASAGTQPGVADATGAAWDASAAVTVNTGQPAAAGSASDGQAGAGPAADVTAGTGAAADQAVAVTVNAEVASGAGAAYDATVTTSSATNAPAEVASGSGVGYDPNVDITAVAETPAGVGAAGDGVGAAAVNGGLTTAVGAGFDALASVGGAADFAAGTGTALDAAVSVTAPAGTTVAVGAGADSTTAVAALPTAAAGGGQAWDTTVQVDVAAETATVAGAGNDATVSTSSSGSATAETASGLGSAPDPTTAVAVNTVTPAGTGTAADASAGPSGQADVAAAVGAAFDAAVTAGTFAASATAAGTGHDSTAAAGAGADLAAAVGTGFDATITASGSSTPGTADAAGAAFNATVAVTATAETPAGTGTAWQPDVVAAGVEAGTRPGMYTPGNTRPRHTGGSTKPRLTGGSNRPGLTPGRSRGPTYTGGG